jgi:hypothetical protein
MNLIELLAVDHVINRSQGRASTWDRSGNTVMTLLCACFGLALLAVGVLMLFPGDDGILFGDSFMLLGFGALFLWPPVQEYRKRLAFREAQRLEVERLARPDEDGIWIRRDPAGNYIVADGVYEIMVYCYRKPANQVTYWVTHWFANDDNGISAPFFSTHRTWDEAVADAKRKIWREHV